MFEKVTSAIDSGLAPEGEVVSLKNTAAKKLITFYSVVPLSPLFHVIGLLLPCVTIKEVGQGFPISKWINADPVNRRKNRLGSILNCAGQMFSHNSNTRMCVRALNRVCYAGRWLSQWSNKKTIQRRIKCWNMMKNVHFPASL